MVRLRIDELLEGRGWTLYRLAKETGIRYPILFRYRYGQTEGIKFAHLEGICAALGCDPGELIHIERGKKVKRK